MPGQKVVLYNPKSVFYTMPLALLALGSYLDPEKYEVKILDGRIDNEDVVLEACRDAICFGVTVLTGTPINDALKMTRKVTQHYPNLVTIWGGWHPTLFPHETLSEANVDVAVNGQGEIPFAGLVQAIVDANEFNGINGIFFKKNGHVVATAPQPLHEINDFPKLNYDLLPVEKYFKLKGRK